MIQITKNFTLEELTRTSKAPSQSPNAQSVVNLVFLCANVLQPIRDLHGAPIRVNSGFRSTLVNQAVGGNPTSQHLTGQAADITTGNKTSNTLLYNRIKASNIPFDQLILENGGQWLHVSWSRNPRKQSLVL